MRTVWLLLLAAIVLTGTGSPHRLSAASAAAAPPVPECRPQSAGERPSATSDDIVNCIFERLRPGLLPWVLFVVFFLNRGGRAASRESHAGGRLS